MKNVRQPPTRIPTKRPGKRAAVRAEETREQAKSSAKERANSLRRQVIVNSENLRPTNSYGTPEYVARGFYIDVSFECKSCGKPQVWTATQQKWWYESAKGDVWTTAVFCRPCRLRERDRKDAARKAHLEGLAKKAKK